MTTLREFIAVRRAEIKKQQQGLKAELAELDRVESTLGQDGTQAVSSAKPQSSMSIKDMVLDVLYGHDEGLNALQILVLIKEKHGQDVMRTSLSPQLSRLKSDGDIQLDGKVWRLSQKAKTKQLFT